MVKLKRSENTRQDLMDEGKHQLSVHGYHGTGIKQILDAVAVPKGSFYNYFESKETFVAAIIEDYTAQNIGLFERFVAQSSLSALDKLRAVNAHMFEQFERGQCQHGCLAGTMAAEIGASSAVCQVALNRSRMQWQENVAELMAAAQTSKELRDDLSVDCMAEMYWATWEGALIRMRLDGSTHAARTIINTALQVLQPSAK